MISSVSGQYLAERFLDCFYIAYTHPSGGVDVPLWVKIFDPYFAFDFEAIVDFN